MAISTLGAYLNAINRNKVNDNTEEQKKDTVQQVIDVIASRQDTTAGTTPTVTVPSVQGSAAADAPTVQGSAAADAPTSFNGNNTENTAKADSGNDNASYKKLLSETLDGILSGTKFSYDHNEDPVYDAYGKQYLRQGQRATEDVLARSSEMTGGVPSSYAVTAAAQAGNNYKAALSDIIPTLYDDAYQRHLNELNQKVNAYKLLADAEQEDWDRRYALASKYAANGDNTYLNILMEELGLKKNSGTDTGSDGSGTASGGVLNTLIQNIANSPMNTPSGGKSNGWFQDNPITFAVSEEDKAKAALEEAERKAAEQKMINDILIAEAELTIARQQEAKRQKELAQQQAQEQTQSSDENKGTTGTAVPYRAGQEPKESVDPYASIDKNSTVDDIRNAGYNALPSDPFMKEGLPGYDLESENELEIISRLDAVMNGETQQSGYTEDGISYDEMLSLGLGELSYSEFSRLVELGVIDLIDMPDGSLRPKMDVAAQYMYKRGMTDELAQYTAKKRKNNNE